MHRLYRLIPAVVLTLASIYAANSLEAHAAGVATDGLPVAASIGVRRLRATDPEGFSALRASFEHSLLSDNGLLIASEATRYGATTLLVPVTGDDISSLANANPTAVKNLAALIAVGNVYLVAGDVSWLAAPTTIPADVTALTHIATLYPRIAGIVYDVDPEQAPAWNSSGRQTIMQHYFTLVDTLQTAPGASVFKQKFFTAHTDYATLHFGGTPQSPTMLTQLQSEPAYSGTYMLVPGGSAGLQLTNLASALPQLTKTFWIEASTSKYNQASYYGQSASYLQSNLTQVSAAVRAKNSNLAGIEVNGWNDLYNSLQSVLPQPPVFNGKLAAGPLVPRAGTTYLGEFINPAGQGPSPAQTLAFEQHVGRTLAYNMHFYDWAAPFPGAVELDDVAHGRIPVIAWNCGDSDAAIAAGHDDAEIIARAAAIKAFKKPIMLRWFWEMNLDDTNDPPRKHCYDPNSDLPNGYFAPGPYIKAWNHIRSVFAAQGVTNVVWLWCVANAHGGPSQYYPGDGAVDWVGMDDYDNNDVSLHDTLFILTEELSQFQEKPLMVTETGAHATAQPAFFPGASGELQSAFPWIRGIGYLDSTGTHQNWILSPTGFADFKAFAHAPYMAGMASNPSAP